VKKQRFVCQLQTSAVSKGDNRQVLHILLITFPFFALVLCGYVAARRGLLPPAAIPGLNAFVLYFALPCMLYRFGANAVAEWPHFFGVFVVRADDGVVCRGCHAKQAH
jgi:Membrane transport protein